jgi:5-methylcytosine-specific restriction endonuclease McrA
VTKEEYSIHLQNPKWKEKRLKILRRDNFICQKCGSDNELNVHHIHYIQGNLPWQVPDRFLITLCRICHIKEHEDKPISSFVIKPKKYKKEQSKRKKKKVLPKLKGRDKKLQEKYDRLKKEGKL